MEHGKRSGGQEEEPRLKYDPLGSESPQAVTSPNTRLCVSDKVLAVGHQDGSVQLLDHLGNQVQAFKEHSREVTDLCFDATAEYLASGSADGSIAVYGLYTQEVQRLKIGQPITTVALDPRYAGRKTRELVYGTAGGTLILSSKGWLGNKETALFTGRGPLRCARMSGTLLAWATDTGLRVYDTATHTRLGKLERPASATADPSAPCNLLWRGERELFVAWGRQVTIVRIVAPPPPAGGSSSGAGSGTWGLPIGAMSTTGTLAAARSLSVIASFEADSSVLGAAPFGADVAALCWGTMSSTLSTAGAAGTSSTTAVDVDGVITGGSSTAEEGAVFPDGQAASSRAEAADGSSGVEAAPATQPAAEAAVDEPAQHQQGVQQQQQHSQEQDRQQEQQEHQQMEQQDKEQELSLCFYSRGGQLLAADALDCRCSAAARRWHQLAFSYTGDADLLLSAAATPAAGRLQPASSSSQSAVSPLHGIPASAPGSGRSTPGKAQLVGMDGAGLGAANDGEAAAPGSADDRDKQQGWQQRHQEDGDPWQQQNTQQREHRQQEGQQGVQQEGQQRQYKWWREGEEPLYLVCTPSAILVGRARDGASRVQWLVEHGRYSQALRVAEEDNTVPSVVRESVGEQCLQSLLADGRYEEAAALCPRVLQGNALAWERWTFTFAQQRQLAALAPHLPTEAPRLKSTTYDLVLSSFLLHPSEHPLLLQLVRSWPPGTYDVAQLQAATHNRMGGAPGDWRVLQEVAARLYSLQGRHEEALRLMLRLRSPAVFDYISHHALVDRLSPFAAALVDVDEVRATSLLVEHCEEVPPGQVVAALQDAAAAAPSSEDQQRWRRRLHHYLDWLFQRDSQLGAAFAELQVELYAEFEPSRLLNFLMVSPSYPLERAYQVCEQRGLVRESVYVLGRMGSADRALRLIVEGLRDVAQAVEFVQLQRDDDLWEQLIALALGDAQLTGELLDHAGGYIDPLRVVAQIPPHMRVNNLRGRLVKIITDFRTQMSLQQGCNTILRHDCVVLANRLYRMLRANLRRLHLRLHHGQRGGTRWLLYDARTGEEAAEDDALSALLDSEGPAESAAYVASTAGAGLGSGGGASGKGGPSHLRQTGPGAAGLLLTSLSPDKQHGPQQQQQRVWVGFLGGPAPTQPPVAADGGLVPPQQGSTHSPSKFVRLAGSSLSPARLAAGSVAPRKLLAT